MKTIDNKVEEVLRYEASRLPEIDEAVVLEMRSAPTRQWLRAGAVVPAAVVFVFLVMAPAIWLNSRTAESPSADQLDQPTVTTAVTAAPLAEPVLDSAVAPLFSGLSQTELGSYAADADNDSSAPYWEVVEETLATTGVSYDDFPDEIMDAAVIGDRAIIVGGNTAESAGIWYSDDGSWIAASIEYPPGIRIGENDGNYRLSDGIMHMNMVGETLVAWENVQLMSNGEPEWAGTFIAMSSDGASWEVQILDLMVGAMAEWDGVAVAATFEFDDDLVNSAFLHASADLVTWEQVADLGDGHPTAIEADSEGVTVTLFVPEILSLDDGSLGIGSEATVFLVRLTNPRNSSEKSSP